MKVLKSIDNKNLTPRLPFFQSVTTYMALDFYNAPGWAWGALGLSFLIIWCLSIYVLWSTKQVDIFEEINNKR